MAVLQAKDDILTHSQLNKQLVDVPEWGEGTQVWVSELTSEAEDAYQASIVKQEGAGKNTEFKTDLANRKAKFAVQCIVDENGKRVFSDNDVSKVAALGARALNRIVDVGYELSGMSMKDLEELEANLSGSPEDGSNSD